MSFFRAPDNDPQEIAALKESLSLDLRRLSLICGMLTARFNKQPESCNENARAWLIGTVRKHMNDTINQLIKDGDDHASG
ncbi:hypothetical protein CI610_01371 [invertebrate metagenome]|uniref:Uncharacterized protein n=1 Tax=invertebrate metagenome TaxID=1711999 RepID=A0A2H9T8Y2_9ZZZZ